MAVGSKYGENFERQVKQLLDAHGASKLRLNAYELAKQGRLDIKLILLLEEIRRVEKLDESGRPDAG